VYKRLIYRAIKNKKIEMAMINTLQLAARKNLIQMSSDGINYNRNYYSGVSRFKNRRGTIPELMQVITAI
jgi:hypothetical protein